MIKDITISDNNSSAFEKEMAEEMKRCMKHFERELAAIRSNRAHTSLIENIEIACYGGQSVMPLKNVASLAAPDARLLTIEPWDKTILADIEKAIATSNLGLTPANDGNIIRLQLPQMTSDRREDLVKILNQKLEECKIAIRTVRKECMNFLRTCERDKDISENISRRLGEITQKSTTDFSKKADSMAKKKEGDLRSF